MKEYIKYGSMCMLRTNTALKNSMLLEVRTVAILGLCKGDK